MRTVWGQHAALQRCANRARLHHVATSRFEILMRPGEAALTASVMSTVPSPLSGIASLKADTSGGRVLDVLANDAVVAGVHGGFVQEQEGLPIVTAVVSDVDAWAVRVSFLVFEGEGRHAGRDRHVGGVQLDGVAEADPAASVGKPISCRWSLRTSPSRRCLTHRR